MSSNSSSNEPRSEASAGQPSAGSTVPVDARAWFERPENAKRLFWSLLAACGLLFVIDVFVHKHGPFQIEHFPGFYAISGFLACAGVAFVARIIRVLVMKPEDYYDE